VLVACKPKRRLEEHPKQLLDSVRITDRLLKAVACGRTATEALYYTPIASFSHRTELLHVKTDY